MIVVYPKDCLVYKIAMVYLFMNCSSNLYTIHWPCQPKSHIHEPSKCYRNLSLFLACCLFLDLKCDIHMRSQSSKLKLMWWHLVKFILLPSFWFWTIIYGHMWCPSLRFMSKKFIHELVDMIKMKHPSFMPPVTLALSRSLQRVFDDITWCLRDNQELAFQSEENLIHVNKHISLGVINLDSRIFEDWKGSAAK
jgi:hypothetical protein